MKVVKLKYAICFLHFTLDLFIVLLIHWKTQTLTFCNVPNKYCLRSISNSAIIITGYNLKVYDVYIKYLNAKKYGERKFCK